MNYIVTSTGELFMVSQTALNLEDLKADYTKMEDALFLFVGGEVLTGIQVADICDENADVWHYDEDHEEWLNIGSNM